MPRYKDLSDRLVALLQLTSPPATVQFRRTRPDHLPRADASLKACMFLDTARFDRRVFWADGADMGPCPGGRYYVGQGQPFDRLLDGTFPSGDYPDRGIAVFGNPEAVRQTLPHYAIYPGGAAEAVCYGPLDLVDFDPADGPATIVILAPAKTAMYLARAATYESGGVVAGPIGPPTCATVMVQPALQQQAVTTLGCFGFRRYVRMGVDEVATGLPIGMLAETVENLARLYRRRPDIAAVLAINEAEQAPVPLAGSPVSGLYASMGQA